jgi:putative isomerase
MNKMKIITLYIIALFFMSCTSQIKESEGNLADIARELGKTDIEKELILRAEKYSGSLQKLWNDEEGIFLNKYTENGNLSHRISPTNFYPLIAHVATQDQAKNMMEKNFYNPDKFWGEWIMPSIARCDSAYSDNFYWRGRIWAPMNFLVYLGLCNYDLPDSREDLAEKSTNLIMKEWLTKRHIHENYNAETGEGDDVQSNDAFYHWGALLSMIQIIENNEISKPLSPLQKH